MFPDLFMSEMMGKHFIHALFPLSDVGQKLYLTLGNITLKFISLVAGKCTDGGVWQASEFGKGLLCLKSVI